MANEQSGAPLRRWRPFYGAFGTIDDAIEEAGGHSRAAFRDVRLPILKLLRGATDDGVAEQLCAALDDAMAEALQTLRVAPAPHRALASTDLARVIGALRNHSSARIRTLAGDVLCGWSVAIDEAVKEELHKLSGDRIRHQSMSTVIADGNTRRSVVPATDVHVHMKKLPATVAAAELHKKKLHIPPVKMLATVPVAEADKKKMHVPPAKMLQTTESKKMEATKRKLHEGYDEAERIKRQHTIKKIDDKVAAKMFEQKQRKTHPIVRGRGPATCRSRISTGVRRSLLSSLHMI